MKIAPADGGNPDADETETQQQYAAKLFIKELDDLKPRNFDNDKFKKMG